MNMDAWDEIAPRYHKRWARYMCGPLQSTNELVKRIGVRDGHTVLDVACGTGLVTKHLREKIGKTGYIVGADTSMTAIKIARKWNKGVSNILFVNTDAENMSFSKKFDVITCQYALFFFPDASKALKNMKKSLKKSGRLGIVTHGSKEKAPFYGAILNAASRFIPDYIPPGTPQLDRYSTKKELREEVTNAGFVNIRIKDHTFEYSPGSFDKYWADYIKYVAKPIKAKIDALGRNKKREFKEAVKKNTIPFTDEAGIIRFPWQVLILTADLKDKTDL